MATGQAPCSGYVLRATKENFEALNISLGIHEKDYEEYKKKDSDGEGIEGFLEDLAYNNGTGEVIFEATPDQALGAVIGIELYFYDADLGDRYDELEHGAYFLLAEEELYTRELSLVGEKLKHEGIFPELQHWTRHG